MKTSITITPSLLDELREFDTPLLAKTINFIGPTPTHEFDLSGEIRSVTLPPRPTVGIVSTTELDSSTPGGVAETGCLEHLAANAVRNRAIEHEAQLFLRRTDRSPAEKRAHVQQLVTKYGLTDCVSGGKR